MKALNQLQVAGLLDLPTVPEMDAAQWRYVLSDRLKPAGSR